MNEKLSVAKSKMIQNAISHRTKLLPFVLFEKTLNVWDDPIYEVPLQPIPISKQIKPIGNMLAHEIDNSIIEALRKKAPTVSAPPNNKMFDELQNITPYTQKKYIGLTNSYKIAHAIQKRPEFLYPQNYLEKGDLFYRGEMGSFGNVRIVRCGGQKRLDDMIILGCSCIAILTNNTSSSNFFVNNNKLEWHFKSLIKINPNQTTIIRHEGMSEINS